MKNKTIKRKELMANFLKTALDKVLTDENKYKNKQTVRIEVRFTPKQYEKLKKMIELSGLKKSKFIKNKLKLD